MILRNVFGVVLKSSATSLWTFLATSASMIWVAKKWLSSMHCAAQGAGTAFTFPSRSIVRKRTHDQGLELEQWQVLPLAPPRDPFTHPTHAAYVCAPEQPHHPTRSGQPRIGWTIPASPPSSLALVRVHARTYACFHQGSRFNQETSVKDRISSWSKWRGLKTPVSMIKCIREKDPQGLTQFGTGIES